ncbi:MAG TPA: CotH kinase family protein [Marinilabiliaceae bacterium]|nr:CotH kinase family protein [Marinilabiliaceae bacterium]
MITKIRLYILFLGVFLFCLQSCEKDLLEEQPEKLFKLNIEVDQTIQPHQWTPMTLHYSENDKVTSYPGKIKRRGGYSISFPKHSYEIDLNKNISLAGLPKDDDWILNANYIDKTFIRHVISYELFTDMNENNEASKSQYIEVELNGKYNGLYVLMEKLDRSSLGINKSDPMAVIFKEPHIFRKSYDGIVPQKPDNFHQQTYPKIYVDDKREFIEGVREFILNSPETSFKQDFSNMFDLNNIIDWHLLILISNNSDGILKNFYLYKIDATTPIKIAPWDYDHSFGRDGDNELNIDERPLNIERSILFARLLKFDWYKKMLKERWEELNEANLFSKAGLKQRITSKSRKVRKKAMENFEIWPVDAPQFFDANGFDEEIDIMLEFVELRHRRLSDYFEEL